MSHDSRDTTLTFIDSTDVKKFPGDWDFLLLFRRPAQGRNRAEKSNLIGTGWGNETGGCSTARKFKLRSMGFL